MVTAFHPAVLEFDTVSVLRGSQTLFAGLSFFIQSGDIMWIQGANGIGKTTLLRLAAGLNRTATGTVHWRQNGTACSADTIVSYQGHSNAQKRHLSAEEDLQFWADIYGYDDDVSAPLMHVGLAQKAHVKTGALSAGQSRRLALARLIISRKPLWLMDEPAAAMDADGQALIFDLIEEHLSYGGMVLLASHEPARPLRAQTRKLTLKAAS